MVLLLPLPPNKLDGGGKLGCSYKNTKHMAQKDNNHKKINKS